MEFSREISHVGAFFSYDAARNLLCEKVFSPPRKMRHDPSKRGVVTGISRRAASRLIKKGVAGRGRAMLTLTYPSDFPDAFTAKSHLRAFLKRLFRKFPRIGVLWRLEFQKRGAPHFHLLIQGVFAFPFLRAVAARAWIQGTSKWGIEHNYPVSSYRYGVRLDDLSSGDNKEISYIAKYMAKAQIWPLSGRLWGSERWREYHDWTYYVKHFPGARIYRILEAITGEYGPRWTITRFYYRMIRRALVDDEFYEKIAGLSFYRGRYNLIQEENISEDSIFVRGCDCGAEECQYENREENACRDDSFFGGEQGIVVSGFDDSGFHDGTARQGFLFDRFSDDAS